MAELRLNTNAPDFELDGIENGAARRFRLADFRGRWLILFFYPADFTFVCPTEIKGFAARFGEFRDLGSTIAGISVDDLASHRDWSKELGGVPFPLLADVQREAARAYGVLNEEDGRAFRATIVVSPEGKIAYFVVSPMNVGRSVDETLRVLKALQTGRLCPADWHPGEDTLDPALRY